MAGEARDFDERGSVWSIVSQYKISGRYEDKYVVYSTPAHCEIVETSNRAKYNQIRNAYQPSEQDTCSTRPDQP